MSAPTQQQNDGKGGDRFKDSLASLRKILMVDKSPSKHLVSGSVTDSEGARLKKELRVTKENLRSINKKSSVLEKKLEEANEQLQRERSLRATLESTYEALAKHKQELTAQVDSLLKTRNEQEEEVKSLQNSLEKQKDKRTEIEIRLTKKLEILELEKAKALKEGGDLEAKLVSSERKFSDMEKKVENATRNFDSERKKVQASCANLERSIEVLRGRLVKADATASTLNSDLEAVTKELEETKLALAQSEDQLPQLAQTAERLGEELDSTRSKLQEALSAKESLEKTQKEQEEQAKKMKNENVAIQEEIDGLRSKHDALIASHKKEMQISEEKSARLELELKQKEGALDEEKTRIDSIEKELKAKFTSKDTLMQKKDEIVETLKKSTVSLQQKLNKLREELATVQKKAEEKEKELTSKYKSVNEELTEARDELQCAEEEVMKTRTKLSQLESSATNTSNSQSEEIEKVKLAAEERQKELQKKFSEEQQKHADLAKSHCASLEASKEATAKLQQLIEAERGRADEMASAKVKADILVKELKEELAGLRTKASKKIAAGRSDLGQGREKDHHSPEPAKHELEKEALDQPSSTSAETPLSPKKRKTNEPHETSETNVETDGGHPEIDEGLDSLKARLLAKKAKLAEKIADKGSTS
mmetsp:Transcript_7712/g.11033  ORF Transcript_7712/g.11033 Transcript_7712/m.11033 type:complete len:652 (+) Transcript_7712:132-2087(+)